MAASPTAPKEREALRRKIPKHYNGYAHLVFTMTISLGTTIVLLSRVSAPSWAELSVFAIAMVINSLGEYLEHRFLLHHRLGFAPFAYDIHTMEHHYFFTDRHFLPRDHRDFYFVLFPLRLAAGYIVGIALPITWGVAWFSTWNAGYLAGAASSLFFFLYEFVHFTGHLGWKYGIAEHHRLHHYKPSMARVNFNVVVPLFDWLLGTRITSLRK